MFLGEEVQCITSALFPGHRLDQFPSSDHTYGRSNSLCTCVLAPVFVSMMSHNARKSVRKKKSTLRYSRISFICDIWCNFQCKFSSSCVMYLCFRWWFPTFPNMHFNYPKKKKKKVRTCSSQLLIGGDKRGFLVKKTVVCRSAMINRLVIDRKLVTTVFCISQLMVLVFPASETQGFNAFLCHIW